MAAENGGRGNEEEVEAKKEEKEYRRLAAIKRKYRLE